MEVNAIITVKQVKQMVETDRRTVNFDGSDENSNTSHHNPLERHFPENLDFSKNRSETFPVFVSKSHLNKNDSEFVCPVRVCFERT